MNVGEAVGHALAQLGVRRAFGVVGSGNFHVTNGLIAAGTAYVGARHEGGAATMADSYARLSGEVAAVSLHPGCGLTNAMTGIGEAAKSRTPLLVITGDASDPASNFFIDQDSLVASVGATNVRLRSAATAIYDARRAFSIALRERRTVVFHLPMDIQETAFTDEASLAELRPVMRVAAPRAADEAVATLAEELARAQRPIFIAGRGARGAKARDALSALAEDIGALLGEGAVAKGLFAGNPWSIDVVGGFSSPLTVELFDGADLVIGWGTALNQWTTRHGHLIPASARVVQVDIEPGGLEKQRLVDLAIVGDVAGTAAAVSEFLSVERHRSDGYRLPEVARRLAQGASWRHVAFDDLSTTERIDPRTLSAALDDIVPKNRVLSIDSGNFMGYPSMYLDVPDENGYVMTQAFQSIGLGLPTAIGAALAQPDRFPVLVSGDGGFLMSIAELETLKRLDLPLLIVVYNDHAYGAEVYHFAPDGDAPSTVVFPDTDIAAIARGYGYDGITVRTVDDLSQVGELVERGLQRPLLVDAKILGGPSWWLEMAMKH